MEKGSSERRLRVVVGRETFAGPCQSLQIEKSGLPRLSSVNLILDSNRKQSSTTGVLYLTLIHLFVRADLGLKSLTSRLVKENHELEPSDHTGQ